MAQLRENTNIWEDNEECVSVFFPHKNNSLDLCEEVQKNELRSPFYDNALVAVCEEVEKQLLVQRGGGAKRKAESLLQNSNVKRIRSTENSAQEASTSNNEGSESSKTWEKLRNNHRRQKISKQKSASGVVNIKTRRFQENTFLTPHRPSKANLNEDIPNDESTHSNSNTIENDTTKNGNDIHESGVVETDEIPESLTAGTADDQGNKRRRKYNTLNSLLTKSIEDHERRAAKRHQEWERLIANTNNDPLFNFFISMYETTKRLSPLSQHNVKTNIFSLVSQEECKRFVEYSHSYSQNSEARSPAEQKPHSDEGTYTSSFIQQQPQEGGTPIVITQDNELDNSGNIVLLNSSR